jgi:hypothetical protein
VDQDNAVDFSAGFNELRMLAQVMRLFQEQPVMLFPGDDEGEVWHTQFIPRPLADEQINQIWSSQGEAIYRPSVVYEIALAPIEPLSPAGQAARVGSVGNLATGDMANSHAAWPEDRATLPPLVPAMAVNISNPQWAPAAALLTGSGAARSCQLSLTFEVPNGPGDTADFSSFPEIEVWIAGDTGSTDGVRLAGQLLQNPAVDSSVGQWTDIDVIDSLTPDSQSIDPDAPPPPVPEPGSIGFVLTQTHWTGIDNTNHSWQLQLFAERFIRQQPEDGQWVNAAEGEAGLRIRSNPLLITLVRETV